MKYLTVKKGIYICFVACCIFLSLELGARILGQKPGLIENYKGFQVVDSLEIYQLYKLDSTGIYSLNFELLDSLKTMNEEAYPSFIYHENVLEIFNDYDFLKRNISTDSSALARFMANNSDSLFNFALSSYVQSPINQEGFKSIPFAPIESDRKKILLLGDSFAYGLSASPSYCSFADLLLAKGYIVYNTGINGVDPAQYAAILKKYLNQLSPDIIVLNFSSASDFMLFPREVKAGQPHEHQTNAGFIESAPLGKYKDAQESYDFYKAFISVPQSAKLYPLCKISSAASYFYGFFVRDKEIYHEEQVAYYSLRDSITREDMALNSKIYIDTMNTFAAENNIPMLNVVIPIKPEPIYSDKAYNAYYIDENSLDISFQEWGYHFPKSLELSDYEEVGVHFNNSGSKKYAEYLDQLISQTLNE